MTIDEMNRRKQELGYTYKQLAKLADLPVSTVQKTLGRITKSPRYETLNKLEKVLRDESSKAWDVFPKDNNYYTGFEYKVRGLVCDEGTGYAAQKKQGDYTYEDYLKIPDDTRMELIDGYFYEMAAPTNAHQLTVGEVYRQLANYVREHNGSCMVVVAPSDVLLDDDKKTVVEPDVYVSCQKDKLKLHYMQGAPDFIVEVLSPSNRSHDMFLKLNKYKQTGVKEYWIVDLKNEKIIVYNLEEDSVPVIYPFESKVPVGIWKGLCEVDFYIVKELLEEWT